METVELDLEEVKKLVDICDTALIILKQLNVVGIPLSTNEMIDVNEALKLTDRVFQQL